MVHIHDHHYERLCLDYLNCMICIAMISVFVLFIFSKHMLKMNGRFVVHDGVQLKSRLSKVQAMQNSSENLFLLMLWHHLIECKLLITKNNFLPYANTFFRSTNTKNSKDVRFFKKHIFSKTCHILCFLLFLCF